MAIHLVMKEEKFNYCANSYDIMDDDIVVGGLSLIEKEDNIIVSSICIDFRFRKRGIGKKVIDILKEKCSYLSGDSCPFAIGFWLKMGATFEYPIKEEDLDEMMNEGIFPPFTIIT